MLRGAVAADPVDGHPERFSQRVEAGGEYWQLALRLAGARVSGESGAMRGNQWLGEGAVGCPTAVVEDRQLAFDFAKWRRVCARIAHLAGITTGAGLPGAGHTGGRPRVGSPAPEPARAGAAAVHPELRRAAGAHSAPAGARARRARARGAGPRLSRQAPLRRRAAAARPPRLGRAPVRCRGAACAP